MGFLDNLKATGQNVGGQLKSRSGGMGGGMRNKAFLDSLKGNSQKMTTQLKAKAGQFKNKDFAQGSMAMCALIAAADGTIDASERQEMSNHIASNEVLKIFNADDLREIFDGYASKLEADYASGKTNALTAIGKLAKKPDQAEAVIQVGILVGGADGNFDDAEMDAVREACAAVNLDPAQFNL